MVELVVTPKRIGGSLAIFIPADVARQEGIQEGRPVQVTLKIPDRSKVFGLLKGKLGPYRSRAEEGLYRDR